MDILNSIRQSKIIFIESDSEENKQCVEELLSYCGKVHEISSLEKIVKKDFSEISHLTDQTILVFPLETLLSNTNPTDDDEFEKVVPFPVGLLNYNDPWNILGILKGRIRKLVTNCSELASSYDFNHKIVYTCLTHNGSLPGYEEVFRTLPLYNCELGLRFHSDFILTDKDKFNFIKENKKCRDSEMRKIKISLVLEN